jgi:hypothetical protein
MKLPPQNVSELLIELNGTRVVAEDMKERRLATSNYSLSDEVH